MRPFLLLFALLFLSPAFAQESQRGTVPPGTAADGSRPSDGAIQGGTILPGERGGMPDKSTPEERLKKCNELAGALRDECLARERSAAGGASRPPRPVVNPTPDTPPPQNPR